MGDNYYEKYPGDYLRDTRHLTVTQHGAYNLLMDVYYAKGKPLQADVALLARSVGCQTKLERDAVAVVVAEFFPISDDGLRHNTRCDKEIAKRLEFVAEQTRKSALGVAARLSRHQPAGKPTGNPQDNPRLTPPSPSPSPSPTTTPTPKSVEGGGFPNFWKIYPRKTGRDAACRAWVSMVQNGDVVRIFEALAWQLESEQWTKDEGKFVPNAEKYLFDRLWTDEPPAGTGPKVSREDKAKFFTARKVVE